LKYNSFFIGALQMSMLKTLSNFQSKTRVIKKRLSKNLPDTEKIFLEEKLFIYTEWIRIFQTIADGIAWRNLKFNRPLVRLFSEGNSPGHLYQIDQDYIKVLSKYLGRMSNFVMANDLTRCLRTSDLTRILSDGRIILYEIKKSGDRLKTAKSILEEMRLHNRFFSKQELKQWVAQTSIMSKKITVPVLRNGKITEERKAEIEDSNIKIQTHFSMVKKLIREADTHGHAQAEVETGYFIEATSYDKIHDKAMENPKSVPYYLEYRREQYEKNVPEWCKGEKSRIIVLSNYMSFLQKRGQYPRNLVPYSVIPFSARNCVRLMMGGLFLRIYYDLNILKEKLEEFGWIVEDAKLSEKELKSRNELYKKQYTEAGSFYKYNIDESLYRLTKYHENGMYQTTLPMTMVLIMLSSMYKTSFLTSNVAVTFVRACKKKSRRRTIAINFLNERKVLV